MLKGVGSGGMPLGTVSFLNPSLLSSPFPGCHELRNSHLPGPSTMTFCFSSGLKPQSWLTMPETSATVSQSEFFLLSSSHEVLESQ